jgi:hypothetical protein
VCESKGIELRHCPPYVREWILSEKPRIRELAGGKRERSGKGGT